MILRSPVLGDVPIGEEAVRFFADGLMGFETLKRNAIVELPEYQPFLWLLSTDDPKWGFALAQPQLFFPGRYEVPLGDSDKDALDLHPGDTVSIFVLVSSVDGGRKLTANLKGPLVVNDRNRMAKQVVIYNPAYSVRQAWLGPSQAQERTPGVVALNRASNRG